MDYILNGRATGSVAAMLVANGHDPRNLRPFVGDDGRSYVSKMETNKEGKLVEVAIPLANATATLRKDAWIHLDQAVVRAARPRLKFVAAIRGAGLTYSVPNAMGKTILQHEKMGDAIEARTSMDAIAEAENDRVTFELESLPLPITHADFFFTTRQLEMSRESGTPLDTTMAEQAGRKVAEEIEKVHLGVNSGYAFGGHPIYGLINFPGRLTQDITAPTEGGWSGATLIDEILAMKQKATDDNHHGPFFLFTSPNWSRYLDQDYSTAKGDNTLRERIGKIEDVDSPMTLDYLTGWRIVLAQKTADVFRTVLGMDLTTVQWESHGGFRQNFKVLAIQVPQPRNDAADQSGIVDGNPA